MTHLMEQGELYLPPTDFGQNRVESDNEEVLPVIIFVDACASKVACVVVFGKLVPAYLDVCWEFAIEVREIVVVVEFLKSLVSFEQRELTSRREGEPKLPLWAD